MSLNDYKLPVKVVPHKASSGAAGSEAFIIINLKTGADESIRAFTLPEAKQLFEDLMLAITEIE